jgi:hypothetical protein
MHAQYVAPGEMEPGEDEDAVSGVDPTEALDEGGIEQEPGVGRALLALLRRGGGIGERRLDGSDRRQLVRGLPHAISSRDWRIAT